MFFKSFVPIFEIVNLLVKADFPIVAVPKALVEEPLFK